MLELIIINCIRQENGNLKLISNKTDFSLEVGELKLKNMLHYLLLKSLKGMKMN